jgi:DNA-binding response OmpR family regulator
MDGQPIVVINRGEASEAFSPLVHQELVLPFTVRKLINRIQALCPNAEGTLMETGRVRLLTDCSTLLLGDDTQKLTPTLSTLLQALMASPGQVQTREDLFRKVWQTDFVGDTRTLDVHISWLRKHLAGLPGKSPIVTVRGVGYRLDP